MTTPRRKLSAEAIKPNETLSSVSNQKFPNADNIARVELAALARN
jgi:hypothetical protein